MISLVAMAVIAASIGSNIYLTKQLARSISLIEELARPPVASRKEASPRKPATMPKQASRQAGWHGKYWRGRPRLVASCRLA